MKQFIISFADELSAFVYAKSASQAKKIGSKMWEVPAEEITVAKV